VAALICSNLGVNNQGALQKNVPKTQRTDTCVAAVYPASRIMGSRFRRFFPIP